MRFMIYTFEIGGRAILPFEAHSKTAAKAIANDEVLRSDLMTLESGGASLWDGWTICTVREATKEEVEVFLAQAKYEDEDIVAFLIPVHDEFGDDGSDPTRH